ncbi:hypothetical protein Tco_0524134, partial [Tanacetum coccineum]
MYSKCGFMDDDNIVFETTMNERYSFLECSHCGTSVSRAQLKSEDAANVRTSLSALHIEETSAVMDRPQMLQRHSATNVNVPRLETFDTARCIGTGSGGLRREWALRIGQTSTDMGKACKQRPKYEIQESLCLQAKLRKAENQVEYILVGSLKELKMGFESIKQEVLKTHEITQF